MNTDVKQISSLMDELIGKNTEAIGVLEKRIDAIRKESQNTEKEAKEKFNQANIKAYRKAVGKIADANAEVEALTRQLDDLRYFPLIPKEKYDSLANQLTGDLEKKLLEKKKKVANLIEEIKTIGEASVDEVLYTNDLLHKLQHDVFRDDCCIERNGERIYMPHLENEVHDNELPTLVTYLTDPTYSPSSWVYNNYHDNPTPMKVKKHFDLRPQISGR